LRVRRFAVVGDPVAHSKSPVMHGAALRALGLPHTYEAVRASADELPRVIAMLREGTFDGLNVTVPHKERVLGMVDELDEGARGAGAANTLVRRADGRLVAYNTDAPALAAEIARLRGDSPWAPDARGLVLGSGGAARGAVAALGLHLGLRHVVVRARGFADASRRSAFAATAPCPVTLEAWETRGGEGRRENDGDGEARTVVVVQATSAGMRGADPGESVVGVVDWASLPPTAVAIDVVYAPRDTPWLRAARARGLRADDGLGMLARQGALALELWLAGDDGAERVKAPVDAMRASLE
jgi:shikimate dehydrogenase